MSEPVVEKTDGTNAEMAAKNEGSKSNSDWLDLSGIHWGYLNCWQSVVMGKKIKTERWVTYWVDLCGSTMRLYKDKSLPPDSATMTPSPSFIGPSKENEQKVAFFDLRHAAVEILSDGTLYNRKLKQADFTRIYRRHLFRLVFKKLNSTYLFQAPSNSSMLRWVSKIQESITMSEYEQIGAASVDERLQLAKFALEQRRWKAEEAPKIPTAGIDSFEDEEDFKRAMADPAANTVDPRLQSLKVKLKEKVELLNQLTQQERLFLGNEAGDEPSDVIEKELIGTSLKDYYLVPGRRETFICKGARMTLFGQLPNKRWRCWIEIDNLVASMTNLLSDLDEKNDSNNNGKSLSDENRKYAATLKKQDFESRGYPLIGSVPSSLVEELQNFTSVESKKGTESVDEIEINKDKEFVNGTPPTSPVLDIKECIPQAESSPAPYSSHARRTPRKTNSQLSFDSYFFNGENQPSSAEKENGVKFQRNVSGNFGNFRTSLFYQDDKEKELPKFNVSVSPTEQKHPSLSPSQSLAADRDDSPASSANSSPVMPVKLREGGFIIRKQLRQKGISIIVGSSSSEDESSESEGEEQQTKEENGEKKDEAAKSLKRFSSVDVVGTQKAQDDNKKNKRLAVRSISTLPAHSTSTTELLEQFGLRSASISGNEDKAKLFPKFKGPDVKPPRNERRTLKLSKKTEKGYGFYLQTFVFTGKTGEKEVKTFVRYVEEEGPAYLAGLREGDIIVEIDGENAEKKDHAQLVTAIKNSKDELLMVVKFIDAVRRADLSIKLKKKMAKLRARAREYEDLVAKENDLLRTTSTMERSDSVTSSGIGLSDDSSENLASINDQVIIQTSRFEERSSNVFDSVKEIRYNEDGTPNGGNARTHITTTSDLLSVYSTDAQLPEKPKKSSKPVHRSRSFSGSEKKIDRETMQPRGRLNSKDDGFITVSPSSTKSRPPAKIISNRNSGSEYNQRETNVKKPLQTKEQMFYDPSKDRSGLPVKSRSFGLQSNAAKAIAVKDGTLAHSTRSGTLSNPTRDRVLSRNSRTKSYKIAVTTSSEGGSRKVAERVVQYEQIKTEKAPETDL